jgi:hypothetical protein
MANNIVWHPFVHESNLKYKNLLSHLLSAQPMHAGHGASTSVWEQMVDGISCEIGPDQQPFSLQPLAVRPAKGCHTYLIKFARKNQGIALRSTGTNNQPECGEMQRVLEAVLEVTDCKQLMAEVGGLKGN